MGDNSLTAHQKSPQEIQKVVGDFNGTSNTSHLLETNSSKEEQLAAAREAHGGKQHSTHRMDPELEKALSDMAQQKEAQRTAHPEELAHKIENEEAKALKGDQQAKLDARLDMERLAHDPNSQYRDAVVKQIVSDGSYMHPFNGAPHAELEYKDGQLDAIHFSSFPANDDTISMTKSVDQQRQEAWDKYETTVTDARSFAHDPERAQKVVDRQNLQNQGIAHPPTVEGNRWFELQPQQ